MKYMGSKSAMLQNGLGHLITRHGRRADRIVDLFAGSGAVSWFAAENLAKPVVAVDLQRYSAVFAGAVIERTRPLDAERGEAIWLEPVIRERDRTRLGPDAASNGHLTMKQVQAARLRCRSEGGTVTRAYGGYYFSPYQAWTLDAMYARLPSRDPWRRVCHAALLMTASSCAAAPGHTAQPFRPSDAALPFIHSIWRLDPVVVAREALGQICHRYARIRGRTRTGDAVEAAKRLRRSDLVIIDPPYSAVQYSRFYHVLETLARGEDFVPEGAGRYPPISDRPQSAFSLVTQSKLALNDLFVNLAGAECTAILTFPDGKASNGLSGSEVVELARGHFGVQLQRVAGRFSTLGGNNRHRPARHRAHELMLVLKPRA